MASGIVRILIGVLLIALAACALGSESAIRHLIAMLGFVGVALIAAGKFRIEQLRALRDANLRRSVAGGREALIAQHLAAQGVVVPPQLNKPLTTKAEWKKQRDEKRKERIAREQEEARHRHEAYRQRLQTEIPFVG